LPTLRVALTGGIATGKSHCLKLFAAGGVPTLDADQLAHASIAPGTTGHSAVVDRFGTGILGPDGAVDRRAMARSIFSDDKARRDLEAIVHPRVYRAIGEWFATLGDRGEALGIADIPLLFETGREIDYDAVIVTSCPPAMQMERLMARSGWTRQDAERRLAAQLPTDAKVAHADYVIDTSGTPEETDNQVRGVLEELKSGAQFGR
jgi:dephospho-CoA kinase